MASPIMGTVTISRAGRFGAIVGPFLLAAAWLATMNAGACDPDLPGFTCNGTCPTGYVCGPQSCVAADAGSELDGSAGSESGEDSGATDTGPATSADAATDGGPDSQTEATIDAPPESATDAASE